MNGSGDDMDTDVRDAGPHGDRRGDDREPSTRAADRPTPNDANPLIFDINDLSVYYGDFRAVRDITLPIREHEITALIGPSGCGKSTFLRCLNRMNDLIEGARVEGTLLYHGVDLYDERVDPVEVRRRIGMVFQKPNPFPKSIYDNVAFGPKIAGFKGNMDDLVEESLQRAALWDEVKKKLKDSGMALSGGQQQRLCIARAIATKPDVILMDEPCSVPRPDRHVEDRGPDARPRLRVHDRDRDAQHAASGAGLRPDRLLHRGRRGRRSSHGAHRGVRSDGIDLHESLGPPNRGLRDGEVRMTREHFHEQLERVELELLSMGELASSAIQRSVEALVQHDTEAAEAVIRDDDAIDEIYLRIDSGVLEMLALQSPVATQLRLVSAILHSCLHLERIGDQAVNIAKLYLATQDLPPSQTLLQQLEEMGAHVVTMIRSAMEAFRTRDLELCLKLPKMDDPVDRLNRATHLEALKLADDPRVARLGTPHEPRGPSPRAGR